jgi:hypothetical protein
LVVVAFRTGEGGEGGEKGGLKRRSGRGERRGEWELDGVDYKSSAGQVNFFFFAIESTASYRVPVREILRSSQRDNAIPLQRQR